MPSTHTLPFTLLIIMDRKKALSAYYSRLRMWHVWSRYFCSLLSLPYPPNAKTHIEIGRDGCKITTMTSLPIDMADARRDSRQHGTKLVWAAAPSVVRRHGRGGSDYLDDCTPPSPHPFPGLFLGWSPRCWSARRLGGRWEMKGRIDQGLVFASPRLPLSIVARRLGPLIERLNIDPPRITWWRKCTNPPMDTNWYWLFAQVFFYFSMRKRGCWNGLLWCHNGFF